VLQALEQILLNAGYSASVIYETINRILDSENTWTGFDLKNESHIDMREAGIIDPTKVTRTALENAASVAGTVLLTECVVVEEPSEEKATPDYNGMF
jgi:chaperonin GroEL